MPLYIKKSEFEEMKTLLSEAEASLDGSYNTNTEYALYKIIKVFTILIKAREKSVQPEGGSQ